MGQHDAALATALCPACWTRVETRLQNALAARVADGARLSSLQSPAVTFASSAPSHVVVLANNSAEMGEAIYERAPTPVCAFGEGALRAPPAQQCLLSKLHYEQSAVETLFTLFPNIRAHTQLGAFRFDDSVYAIEPLGAASANLDAVRDGVAGLRPGAAGSRVGAALASAETALMSIDRSQKRSVFLVSGRYRGDESPRPAKPVRACSSRASMCFPFGPMCSLLTTSSRIRVGTPRSLRWPSTSLPCSPPIRRARTTPRLSFRQHGLC
jgi:hypothetical protein